MSQLILEAFRELKGLKEDVFSFDKQGALELKDFLHQDRKKPTTVEIIDPDADEVTDLQDDYSGEVILSCCACHGLIPKSPKEVVIDKDTQRANVDEACPCCFNKAGYRIMAQIPAESSVSDSDEDVTDVEEAEELEPSAEESVDVAVEPSEEVEVKSSEEEDEATTVVESMEQKVKIPEPFDKYYVMAQGDQIADLTSSVEEDAKWFKEDFDAELLGWAVAKDEVAEALKQEGLDVVAVFELDGKTEVGQVVGGRLFALDPEEDLKILSESREDVEIDMESEDDDDEDLWNIVYAALGENGEQIKNPNSDKGTYIFNRGVGYTKDQLGVDGDGNIVIRTASKEELAPAKEVAEQFIEKGVTYEIKMNKYDKTTPYAIVISIPADKIGDDLTEELKPVDYDIYYRESEDSDWEHYDTIHDITDLNKYMDDFAEWLDDDSTPHWEYDENQRIVSDGYGQEYRFDPIDKDDAITESVENVTVETDSDTITVKPSEDGKVSVEAAPKEVDAGALEPVSAEVQAEIESNDSEVPVEETPAEEIPEDSGESADLEVEPENEDEEVTITDFDEQAFDELGESYLKRVYDNVDSFKTSQGFVHNDKLKLEGVIKFSSGKMAKTSFVFEGFSVSKRGKYKFLGENIQITNRKNAFILTGDIKEGKLLPESLTYNYHAKDGATGKSQRVYGTCRRK